MSAYNSTISDLELRDLFRSALIEGDETTALTETFIEMERQMVFGSEAAFVLPLHKEQELFNQLNHGLGTKLSTAGKLGMKWIFTGLGGACVATGLVVYTQLQPSDPAPQRTAIAPATISSKDTARPQPADSVLVQAPTVPAPEPVTKQFDRSEPLFPATSFMIGKRTDQPVQEWETAARGQRTEEAAPPPTYDEDDEALSDTVFTGIKRLEIDIDVADVHILPSPDDKLTLADPIKHSAIQQKGSVLKITTPKNSQKKIIRLRNDQITEGQILTIHVPNGTDLVLHTSAGQLTIDGLTGGDCEASCDYGDVRIANSTLKTTVRAASGNLHLEHLLGPIDATVSFGDLKLSHNTGNLVAHVASGNIESHHLTGEADIQCDFGDVEMTNVRGELKLRAASGNITLDSIYAQQCSVMSDFGNVELSQIYANTHVIANSGNVELDMLTGNLVIESTFGNVTATKVKGALELSANSGQAIVRDLEGDLHASVDFGDLKIQNSKGNALLVVTSGSIETKNMELTDSLHITIDFGDGKFGLKNKSEDLRFDLESTFGEIKINKGDMKLEKENGAVTGGSGRIAVRGTASSGSLTFN